MAKKQSLKKAKLEAMLGDVERKAPSTKREHGTCQAWYCVP